MYQSLSASIFYLSSVVAHELLAGAHPGELRDLERGICCARSKSSAAW